MTDAADMQKRMQELQNSDTVHDLFSKVVSGGKKDYKTVIEKDKPQVNCDCGKSLYGDEKFCPECGCKCEQ